MTSRNSNLNLGEMTEADADVFSRSWLVLMGASTVFLFIVSPPVEL